MRWGFAWELGPFEIMDAIGVKAFAGPSAERRSHSAGGHRESAGQRAEGILRIGERHDDGFRYWQRWAKKVEEPKGVIILQVAERCGTRSAIAIPARV